ncbi:MAG: flagellar basal body P-ring formation chaperone FlgA [Planctomycetota bacterium]
MKQSTSYILMMTLLVTACFAGAADDGLRIFLPSQKVISDDVIELGDIAIVLGDTEIARKINQIPLGTFAVVGQEIKVDRQTILSRLASEGIKPGSVKFNGSEITEVRRQENSIGASQFLETARNFVNAQLKGKKIESMKLVRAAVPYAMKESMEGVQLVPKMSPRQSGGVMRVTVSAMHQGVELTRQELIFGVQYQVRQLVALQDLPVGTMITPDNVAINTVVSNRPEADVLSLPYGMMTRQRIAKDKVVRASMVQPKEAPLLVKRRQKVVLKFETGAFSVSTQGEAKEDGKVGDMIRVERGIGRDRRTVIGTVMPDGTVKPVL